jgi:hypothetical protein
MDTEDIKTDATIKHQNGQQTSSPQRPHCQSKARQIRGVVAQIAARLVNCGVADGQQAKDGHGIANVTVAAARARTLAQA